MTAPSLVDCMACVECPDCGGRGCTDCDEYGLDGGATELVHGHNCSPMDEHLAGWASLPTQALAAHLESNHDWVLHDVFGSDLLSPVNAFLIREQHRIFHLQARFRFG